MLKAATTCIVVDDEPPAREILLRYIENLPQLELVGAFGNAIEAMAFLNSHPVGLIFLDIKMPQLNGNELLKSLKNPPPVIFTTAHAEYALEGFELDVVDYLLKPIRFDRFLKSVNKALSQSSITMAPEPEQRQQESFVYFRADRKMVKVMLNDILYIESLKDYVKVVTETETIITKQPLNAVESMLPDRRFVRTHRSFIVSLSKIRSFTQELIDIRGTEIPIGKLFRISVMKMLEA